MFDKLQTILTRYNDVQLELAEPSTMGDIGKIQKLGSELSDLRPMAEKITYYKRVLSDIEGALDVINTESDTELQAMAKTELEELKAKQLQLEEELKVMLLPKDVRNDKNVIIEVRAGTGGDEAGLFAMELMRAYMKYADIRVWRSEILSQSENGVGGIKEAVVAIYGQGAFSRLKYESGVHRVQRVPVTESSGRIHTSTATVLVMPEAEELDLHIDPGDLKIDVFRAGGHGGQGVNTTDSAVRMTHIPTGLVVNCQDERSQLKNKAKALSILRSRLYDLEQQKMQQERSSERHSLVGSGDRSEKIRTYNFPQDRITDHRIHLSVSNMPDFLSGNLDRVIDPLIVAEQTELLSQSGGNK